MPLLPMFMSSAEPTRGSTRRHFIVQIATACAAASVSRSGWGKRATDRPTRILVVGDSLSAEYGLKRDSGWVKLLADKIKQQGYPAEVVNASISGDTTSGGRQRLPALLDRHQPGVVILELGANDALRGLSLKETADNLGAMAAACEAAGARVVLVGIQVPPNYGRKYTDEFAQVFPALARQRGAALVPFLLKGVADAPDALRWFQSDRIHPTEAAQPRLVDNVWPVLQPLLSKG